MGNGFRGILGEQKTPWMGGLYGDDESTGWGYGRGATGTALPTGFLWLPAASNLSEAMLTQGSPSNARKMPQKASETWSEGKVSTAFLQTTPGTEARVVRRLGAQARQPAGAIECRNAGRLFVVSATYSSKMSRKSGEQSYSKWSRFQRPEQRISFRGLLSPSQVPDGGSAGLNLPHSSPIRFRSRKARSLSGPDSSGTFSQSKLILPRYSETARSSRCSAERAAGPAEACTPHVGTCSAGSRFAKAAPTWSLKMEPRWYPRPFPVPLWARSRLKRVERESRLTAWVPTRTTRSLSRASRRSVGSKMR